MGYHINLLKCISDNCTVKPVCEHFGFVNKDCECRCPKGLRGPVCNNIDGSKYLLFIF